MFWHISLLFAHIYWSSYMLEVKIETDVTCMSNLEFEFIFRRKWSMRSLFKVEISTTFTSSSHLGRYDVIRLSQVIPKHHRLLFKLRLWFPRSHHKLTPKPVPGPTIATGPWLLWRVLWKEEEAMQQYTQVAHCWARQDLKPRQLWFHNLQQQNHWGRVHVELCNVFVLSWNQLASWGLSSLRRREQLGKNMLLEAAITSHWLFSTGPATAKQQASNWYMFDSCNCIILWNLVSSSGVLHKTCQNKLQTFHSGKFHMSKRTPSISQWRSSWTWVISIPSRIVKHHLPLVPQRLPTTEVREV